MSIGIYKITSPTGKTYIGQSIDIEKRLVKYKYITKRQTRLKYSFDKYGLENHIFEIIELCEIDKLNERERYWQDYYDVIGPNGLNCRLTGTNDKSGKISEISKQKMIDKLKIIMVGENNPFFGKQHSKESSKKMSVSRMGNTNRVGRKHSEETKLKMSEKAKQRKLTRPNTGCSNCE